MKYLMGLMITFAIGVSSFAQDNTAKRNEPVKSKCNKSSSMNKGDQSKNMGNQSGATGDLKTKEVEPGIYKTCGYSNGSVEYAVDPEVSASNKASENENSAARSGREESSDASASMQQSNNGQRQIQPSETEQRYSTSDVASAGSSLPDLGVTCAVNQELNSRTGSFKDKKNLGEGELSMKREKDGKEKATYKSDNEFYTYEKGSNGKEEFVHYLQQGNEVVELRKNKNGTADIIYQGHFNSLDEANQALSEGLMFTDVASACNQ